MGLIDKNSILSAPDLKRETVKVPEWGPQAEVIIQEMSALDRDRFYVAAAKEDGTIDPVNFAAKLLVRCIVNQEGARLFVDEEAEPLGRKSQAALKRLFDVARRLNGMAEGADEAAKK
ncbi:MAG: hypothetical protein ACOY8P_07920 [Thermodesulfobacteriota bacterium]